MLSPQTIKPEAVVQARNKLQQKAVELSAEASSVHRCGAALTHGYVLALSSGSA